MYDGGKEEFLYRKNTRQATNVAKFQPKRCRGDCGAIVEVTDAAGKKHKHHRETAKQGYSTHCKQYGLQAGRHSQDQLYRVPGQLIKDILRATLW